MVTLWIFLGQILSADHSCRAAVARLIAHRVSRGQSSCSAETGAYCQARKRLPETFFSTVARLTGRTLENAVDPKWLWKGRRVLVYDGSSVSIPDTPENQRDYPQPETQKAGLGFPLARLAAVFSLSCGAVLDLGICRYAGKGQSELGMLRTLWRVFLPGDVMLADRLMCSWADMVLLKARGVETVTRLSKRKADFRRGKRLARGDHIVRWLKPTKPRSMDRQTYNALPEFLLVRECRIQIEQPGFRIRTLVVVTTLLDAEAFSRDDLVQLYYARWNAEIYQPEGTSSANLYRVAARGKDFGYGAVAVGGLVPSAHGGSQCFRRQSRARRLYMATPLPPRTQRVLRRNARPQCRWSSSGLVFRRSSVRSCSDG